MDPMPRPIWSGAISFGLVSIPVKLYNAVNRKSVSFNQLDSRDNQRIRYRKVNADTGDEVPDDLIVKGYEVTKGRYVVVDPDELEQFMPTVTRSIDLDEFVDLTEIDPLFYDSPYYLAPDKVTKPYALLARAMEEAGKVGVGRFVMRNKEYVAAVRPVDGRLVLSTMVHADEVVDPITIDELEGIGEVEISAKELKMAEQLVASLAGPFELGKYPDNYRLQVLDLLEKRAAGEEIEVPERPATAPQVVDLMAALEASVKAAKEARGRHPTAMAAADEDSGDEVAEVTDVAKRPARKATATKAKAAKAPAARKRKSA
jgi:DNA end-binding protein Ku